MTSSSTTSHLSRPSSLLIGSVIAFWIAGAVEAASPGPSSWPNCLAGAATDPQQQSNVPRVDITATPVGCQLVFASAIADTGPTPTVLELSPSGLIAGVYDGSLGRPPAVQITNSAAAAGADAVVAVPPGGVLLLQDLLLTGITLADPDAGNPSRALLPTNIPLGDDVAVQLRDVIMQVTKEQLQQYVSFMLGVPQATISTDNASFLHIKNYTNLPFGVVQAWGLTLIAPAEAAASGDAAGIVTVTDSYVLAATNKTLVPLMQQLAGKKDSQQLLYVNLAANMTLSPTIWGPDWPPGGVVIRRPVIWCGSSWRTTSLDMGMDVGQVDLSHHHSNLTLMSVALENLAYGDEQSSKDAEGNSILLSNQLWAFKYKRSVPRLVLIDDVLVLPEQQQIDSIIYWVNAFNSDLPFWRSQTTFLRQTLKYTVIQYTVGKVPGEYIIIKALKKDQLMYNLTYTTTTAAAPKLALPFNASIHQKLVEGQADPVVGTILSARGLAVTIWNQRRAACSRPHVLIASLSPMAENGWVSWAPVRFNTPGGSKEDNMTWPAANLNDPQGSSTTTGQPSTTLLQPFSLSGNSSGATAAVAESSDDMLSPVWPPPGGEVIRCPLAIRGPSPSHPTRVDLGFGRGMFKVEAPADSDIMKQGPQGAQGLAAAAASASAQANSPGALLQLSELTFISLPQGSVTAADGHVDRAAAPAIGGGGGSSAGTGSDGADAAWVSGWVSNLPAQAWTHLMWFIDRQFSNDVLISLSNITLMLPVLEARQFAEAANSAYQAAGGDSATAVLSVLYPTADGPLPVSYRSISMNGHSAPAAAANSTTAAGGGRRLLLQQQVTNRTAAPGPGPLIHICVDSMSGLGLVGRNICFMELQNAGTLPPGYVWATGALAGAAAWPAWKTAVVILAVLLPVLAAAAVAAVVLRRRRRVRQQQLSKAVTADDAKVVLNPLPHDRHSTGSGSAAAAAGACLQETAGSTKSYGSGLAQMLAQCCPRTSSEAAGVTPAAPGTSGSSSLVVHTPQVAAAPPAAVAAGLAAAAAGFGESAGVDGMDVVGSLVPGSQQQTPWAGPTLDPTLASSLYQGEGSSLVVTLGEQLGQLAAIHKRTIFQQDLDHRVFDSQGATLGDGESSPDQRMQVLTQYQQQRQQQRGMLVITSDSQASTLQRLTNAISTVSTEMQLRKLGRVSTTATGQSLSPQPSGASAAATVAGAIATNRLAAAAAAGGCGVAVTNKRPSRTDSGSERGGARSSSAGQQQQQEQHGVNWLSLSIEEEPDTQQQQQQQPMMMVMQTDAQEAVGTAADVAQPPPGGHNRSPSLSGLLVSQVPAEGTPPRDISPAAAAAAVGSRTAGLGGKSRRTIVASSSNLSSQSTADAAAKRQVAAAMGIQLQLHEVIGSGTFGVVYRATWRGIPAAVKVMQLSGSMVGCGGVGRGISDKQSSRREQMAVMETALGSSLSHPNIVQVYTYHIRPLHGVRVGDGDIRCSARFSSSTGSSGRPEGSVEDEDVGPRRKGSSSSSTASAVVGYELQLVMEYCALGSLRDALDNGLLDDRLTGRPHYLTVLTLALGVARAMHHLHSEGVLHGDLKCGNVLLKMDIVGMENAAGGAGGSGAAVRIQGLGMQFKEQLTAKVADFGLATRLHDTETHVSGVHRGTLNHMSPELLVHGHASRASDVYAMGILLWEMATGGRAFSDVPKAMLGAAVVRDRARPEWPDGSSASQAVVFAAATAAAAGSSTAGPDLLPSQAYRQLTAACWAHEARDRPSFSEVSSTLEALLDWEQQKLASLAALAEARSAAQIAAAAAAGYAARTSAEFEWRAPLAVDGPGAPASGGQQVTSRPTDTAAAAAAAAPSSATYQTVVSTGAPLESTPPAPAAASVHTLNTAHALITNTRQAPADAGGGAADAGQQGPERLNSKSPFEMLKDRSAW